MNCAVSPWYTVTIEGAVRGDLDDPRSFDGYLRLEELGVTGGGLTLALAGPAQVSVEGRSVRFDDLELGIDEGFVSLDGTFEPGAMALTVALDIDPAGLSGLLRGVEILPGRVWTPEGERLALRLRCLEAARTTYAWQHQAQELLRVYDDLGV